MRRLSIMMIPIVALCTSCSGPIETRIKTQSGATLPAQKQYNFTAKPEQDSAIYQTARKAVAAALAEKNFSMADDAPILVHIALASRPASIALTKGSEDNLKTIAAPKKRKPLQSCDDVEHRLIINMVNSADGATVYFGSAAEYHCKGTMSQSLPHLVNGALSNLGRSDSVNEEKTRTRAGIE
ncbi:MAG: hypothetical protein ABJO01_12255 [Parasphingorhabdus sp.]|uniref:hypothetical protein n=1 Tax=Parasphingorhabdus sp. TaxID=2709688 RepID=UPI0032996669